jgi:outer membrane protein OmpA-like peptidoglycan-associated protein
MSYKTLHLYIALLLVPLFSLELSAQERARSLFAGPCGGFGGGFLSGSIPVYAGSGDCGVFRTGTTENIWGGGRMDFPSLLSERLGISAQLAWSHGSGTFETIPVGRESVVDPESGELVQLDRRYRLELQSSAIQLDLLAHYRLNGRWDLTAGPRLGWRLAVRSSQTDNLLGPGDIGLGGGHRSVVMSDGISLRGNPLLLGFSVGIAHELPVGDNAFLAPMIAASTELTSPVREAGGNRFTLEGGMALLFDLTPGRPEPDEPPAVHPPKETPRLAASITLNSIDDSGHAEHVTVVHASEVLYRKYTPLLPLLFFDRDSASLPPRYLHDGTPDPDSLALALLHGMGALDIHRNNPDVIGMRMLKYPGAMLNIYGTTSLDEPPALARSRAEAVRNYLERVWKIAPSRLRIADGSGVIGHSGQSTEDGRAENRRVEFTSNQPAILAPIASERIVRDFNPPSIAMEPTMEAEAGVKGWTITIRQAGILVARYSNNDSMEQAPDITWHIADDRIDSIPSPISVELRVEDSTGATVTARDQIPILFERRVRIIEKRGEEDADRVSYRLVAFDYNSPEPNAEQREALQRIAETIDTGSQVKVIGYTDRIGGEEYSIDLSRRRAVRIATILQGMLQARAVQNIHISGEAGGIEAERFGSDTPEGRILSRGVLVTVEHRRSGRADRP